MTYPKVPANMPTPVEVDVRIKVTYKYYATEEEARIAADYFREEAAYKHSLGYDFGYNSPGYVGLQSRNGLWLAIAP